MHHILQYLLIFFRGPLFFGHTAILANILQEVPGCWFFFSWFISRKQFDWQFVKLLWIQLSNLTITDQFSDCLLDYSGLKMTNKPLNVGVVCRRQGNFQIYKKKKKKKKSKWKKIHFTCHIWIDNEKCIQMSTNKPSISSVVLEIAPWIWRKICQILIFSSSILLRSVQQYNCLFAAVWLTRCLYYECWVNVPLLNDLKKLVQKHCIWSFA